MIKFEKVSKYADIDLPLPERKTANSAGYDFVVAEDIVVPSYYQNVSASVYGGVGSEIVMTLDNIANWTKTHYRPTLVPTGMKCYLEPDMYLELSTRSSCPLKNLLILANGEGIVDSDYVDNPDNEGHIFFQIINLSPFDIALKRGDRIGQGIIKYYQITDNDSASVIQRTGGFGSTGG